MLNSFDCSLSKIQSCHTVLTIDQSPILSDNGQMMDTYSSFKALKEDQTNYHINWKDRNAQITILAPHGGNIEPHTSEIAELIAADKYNLYCFNGLRSNNNHILHITSHNYDEERALDLVRSSAFVITVHGCTQRDEMVFIGGLYDELKQHIAAALGRAEIPSIICDGTSRYGGQRPDNICNKGISGKGVQLEISRPLRDSPKVWDKIAAAMHEALAIVHPD